MATLPPNPWKALGIDRAADKREIRAAYKKLVLRCHPDKVQDPTLKAVKMDEYQKVQQAYELLMDDEERIKYEDQLKLHELRKQAAIMARNMPNSSTSRSSPRSYEIRMAEPKRVPAKYEVDYSKDRAWERERDRERDEFVEFALGLFNEVCVNLCGCYSRYLPEDSSGLEC